MTGTISGVGAVTKIGAGTLRLSSANSYTGGTTVSAGTLRTTTGGALGMGPLTIGNAAVNLGGDELNVTALTMTDPAAALSVAAAKTLTVTQASGTANIAGTITLTGATSGAGGALVKAGDSTLEINRAPQLGQNSALTVGDNGTLRLNVTAGMPSVGAGATVTVANTASLELAGSTSALVDATTTVQRASINNISTATAGVHVLNGAVQQVGGIDGSGNVVLDDSTGPATSLTADHINQTSLVIGTGSIFTLAPSDADGNPMASAMATLSPGPASPDSAAIGSGGLILAGSLAPASSFLASNNSLLGVGGAASSTPAVSLGGVVGASLSAVPEPSTIALLLLGFVAALPAVMRRMRRA